MKKTLKNFALCAVAAGSTFISSYTTKAKVKIAQKAQFNAEGWFIVNTPPGTQVSDYNNILRSITTLTEIGGPCTGTDEVCAGLITYSGNGAIGHAQTLVSVPENVQFVFKTEE